MVIAAGEGGPEGSPGDDGAACVAIDIADGAAEVAAAAGQQQLQEEHGSACRICQLGDGALPERVSGRLVRLGCDCRGDLAVAHRRCAEAWFTIRGDRCCEICGKNAENVHGGIGAQKFMLQWHDTPAMEDGGGTSGCGCSKTQSCCNLLIGCLIIMLILPWLRHDHVL